MPNTQIIAPHTFRPSSGSACKYCTAGKTEGGRGGLPGTYSLTPTFFLTDEKGEQKQE